MENLTKNEKLALAVFMNNDMITAKEKDYDKLLEKNINHIEYLQSLES